MSFFLSEEYDDYARCPEDICLLNDGDNADGGGELTKWWADNDGGVCHDGVHWRPFKKCFRA